MRPVSLSLGWYRVLMTQVLILVRDLKCKQVLCQCVSESMLTKYSFLFLTGIAQPGCTSPLQLVTCTLSLISILIAIAGAVPVNISNGYTNMTALVRTAESDVLRKRPDHCFLHSPAHSMLAVTICLFNTVPFANHRIRMSPYSFWWRF